MINTEKGLKEFVELMKLKLDLNQEKKGDSWITCDIEFLEDKLGEELEEYLKTKNDAQFYRSAQELVDVANICMMLHHRYIDVWAKQAAEKMFGGEKD